MCSMHAMLFSKGNGYVPVASSNSTHPNYQISAENDNYYILSYSGGKYRGVPLSWYDCRGWLGRMCIAMPRSISLMTESLC